MSSLVLDAGAFISFERRHRRTMLRFAAAQRQDTKLRTPAVVLAQVWRGGQGDQARLARLLKAVEVVPVDEELGRKAGSLLGRSGTGDPIDATVVLVADKGDTVLTSDPRDITRLAWSAGVPLGVIAC